MWNRSPCKPLGYVDEVDAEARRDLLRDAYREARACARCPQLAQTRTQVVFGAGNADADLMFIGEAPGASEDEQGVPFVGRAGKLLDQLLGEIGLAREDVFITNVLMCRPPDNRDPRPAEVEACQEWLWRKIELVRPIVVCTLGNFATKLLRDDPTGITQVHGQVQERTLGSLRVRLLPVFHPAAALYTRSNVDLLRADLARIPALLALGALEQPSSVPIATASDQEPVAAGPPPANHTPQTSEQLGLF